MRLILSVLALLIAAAPARADDAPADAPQSVCLMIESAARAHALPVEFLARVIWRESRFDADAVGPKTRSGKRAQGIAQFMPGTAAERNLLDPFDPVQALPKAAEFLSDLRGQFGNLGLAAAAYNAGPRRVREWLDGSGFMPGETRRYVEAVTGRAIEQWKDVSDGAAKTAPADCAQMMAMLKRAPNAFVTALEQHVTLGAARAWGVQLAAGFSRERALSAYARVLKRFAAPLQGKDPALIGSVLRSRGTRVFYRVRVGTDTRAEADRLCGTLRAQGGACLVLRNGA